MTKHRAIFKGEVVEEYWVLFLPEGALVQDIKRYLEIVIKHTKPIKKYRVLGEEKIWDGCLSSPLLSKGDSIFIFDIEEEVEVEDRIRTTERSTYIYKTRYATNTTQSNIEEETLKFNQEEAGRAIKNAKEKLREIEQKSAERSSIGVSRVRKLLGKIGLGGERE